MEDDTYRTIAGLSESTYTEKRSKFIAMAMPVTTVEDAESLLKGYRNEYHDARHVCYAYMIGADRTVFRVNDNGEPSGTAGRPILGQINSNGLTDILIVVVRYFGGIKLGTSGLIAAYRTAASQAVAAAEVVEKTVDEAISVVFEYPFLNDVMHIVKNEPAVIADQRFDSDCRMTLCIRRSLMPVLRSRLLKVESLYIENDKMDKNE